MTRHLSTIGISTLALLAACKGDISVSQINAELSVSPTLTDVGTVPVGEAACFTVKISHERGPDIKISDVAVTNIEGTYFRVDGDEPTALASGETIELPLCYEPTETGYHRATVEVTHNGEDSPATVDVRGQAVLPDATLWPLGLDFGPVDPGDFSTRQLTIANQSDLDLTVTEANVSNGVFSVVSAVPFTVGGGQELVIQLRFDPTDTTPQVGSLTLQAGDVGLPQVGLRGNDCDNGDPDAYDQDEDGYTSCGGDCDDLDSDVHPGAIEIGNTIDDDCDGDADEGTHLYDDDGDGYCEGPGTCTVGASGPGDCSDSADAGANTDAVNPGATEIMNNGIDDDCDGVVDQGTTDGDGDGYSQAGGDCDDTDATVYPGAPELPDFVNNDCDLLTDEGTIYYDDDGDGYCEDIITCSDGSTPGDCDDDSVDRDGIGGPDGRPTNPGAVELADWRDNDCDGTVDEGTVQYDDDGDGYTENGGDCNDNNPSISPAFGNCP